MSRGKVRGKTNSPPELMTDPNIKNVCNLSWYCDSMTKVFWIGWYGVKYPRGFELQAVQANPELPDFLTKLQAESVAIVEKYRLQDKGYRFEMSLQWLYINPYSYHG